MTINLKHKCKDNVIISHLGIASVFPHQTIEFSNQKLDKTGEQCCADIKSMEILFLNQ